MQFCGTGNGGIISSLIQILQLHLSFYMTFSGLSNGDDLKARKIHESPTNLC